MSPFRSVYTRLTSALLVPRWAFEISCLVGFFSWFGGIILAQIPSWKLRAMFLVVSFMCDSWTPISSIDRE